MKLKKLRKSMGLTQEQMADKVGVYRHGYNAWERGMVRPSLKNIRKINDLFSSEIEELNLKPFSKHDFPLVRELAS